MIGKFKLWLEMLFIRLWPVNTTVFYAVICLLLYIGVRVVSIICE